MSDPARQAFDRLYGHLLLSGQDAAWHVFKSGWEAREQPAPAQPLTDEQIANLFSDSLKAGEGHSVTDWVRRIEAAHGITEGGA